MTVYIDFETRSECDLKKHGAWLYSKHPSTEVLCMAYAIDDLPVQLWTRGDPWPTALDLPVGNGHTFEAHNAFFEWCIWHNTMPRQHKHWPPHCTWECSAALAASFALPRSLDDASRAMGLSQLKDKEGYDLMMKMCKPMRKATTDLFGHVSHWHETPDDLKRLGEYCKQDVETERALSKALGGRLNATERRVYQVDQRLNRRGVRVDVDAARAFCELVEVETKENKDRLADLTAGAVTSGRQNAKMLAWLNDECNTALDNLKAKTVVDALAGKLDPLAREVLRLRQSLAKSSTAKFDTILDTVDPDDDRVRELVLYHGASTGRWAGKGIQIQNFPRGELSPAEVDDSIDVVVTQPDLLDVLYGDAGDVAKSCLRGMITASPGRELIGADYAAIEARVLVWLAEERQNVDVFRRGGDPYKELAASVYGIDVDQVSKAQRQLGKVAELGLGYGMGVNKFVETAQGWGIDVKKTLAQKVVDTYRQDKHRGVVALWRQVEDDVRNCIEYQAPAKRDRYRVNYIKPFLFLTLPSGRRLAYHEPKIETDGKFGKGRITYNGQVKGAWVRQDTYGGRLVEQITQGIARDVMASAMVDLDALGYEIVLTVHDELVCDGGDLDEMCAVMETVPDWADGLPLKVEGWTSRRFRKG